jgi:hypothetical protein
MSLLHLNTDTPSNALVVNAQNRSDTRMAPHTVGILLLIDVGAFLDRNREIDLPSLPPWLITRLLSNS